MPRLNDGELDRLIAFPRMADLPRLVSEIRRLRDLIARAHPHLDAMAAPQDLQDELAAEVREIAADRVARAHATAGGDTKKPG